ncbi:hypothetical protein [Catenovulum adriaticum]|uniref:Beta-porphyranase A C-terminal domain-containing protein n=1 Tax=Catenovulum adriaticum TaxID=2984846 RepID=A0ABY7ASM9_9ALTE|nr:hypothetical protein [Catenovulum sp. TS8]WAJ71530.1 hypothetical protein OLW01_06965 [Catenovulum sp. TS8]
MPYSALQTDNDVQVQFSDTCGYVSSMALQVVTGSKALTYSLN